MAIFHCSIKVLKRGAGRSSVAAIAYRAGEKITDLRTGVIHDFRKKQGIEGAVLFAPDGTEIFDRGDFWNSNESTYKRNDAVTAREIVIAFPSELSAEQRKKLGEDFAKATAAKYGIAADIAFHATNKKGDEKNFHAHILTTTCEISIENNKPVFGKKVNLFDPIFCQKNRVENAAISIRKDWEDAVNLALRSAQVDKQISRLSLKAQGVQRVPEPHYGQAATAILRRGEESVKRTNWLARAEAAKPKVTKPAKKPAWQIVREQIAAKKARIGRKIETLPLKLPEAQANAPEQPKTTPKPINFDDLATSQTPSKSQSALERMQALRVNKSKP